MKLMKREPSIFSAIEPLFDVRGFFDEFDWPLRLQEAEPGLTLPRVDVVETESDYEIKADLPGVEKDNLEITLEEGVLTIKAATKSESEEKEKGRVIRRERRSGTFLRRMNLGSNIAEKEVSANFKHGVLNIHVPKLEPLKPEPVKIDVA